MPKTNNYNSLKLKAFISSLSSTLSKLVGILTEVGCLWISQTQKEAENSLSLLYCKFILLLNE